MISSYRVRIMDVMINYGHLNVFRTVNAVAVSNLSQHDHKAAIKQFTSVKITV